MWCVASLGTFLRDVLAQRDESPETFSRRCIPPVSTALIYQIMSGKDNVKRSTFQAIAVALGMTTVELEIATGGGGEMTADEIEALTHYRRVPPEQRPAAKSMLWGLAIQPTQRRSIGRRDGGSMRRKATIRELQRPRANGPDLPEGSDYTVDRPPDSIVPGRAFGHGGALVPSIAGL